MPQSGEARVSDEVVALARTGEPERYFAALLAPREVRDDLITIAAFVGEIARIPRIASDPRIAAIRLQWWTDTISGFGAEARPTGSPLADALQAVAARRPLVADDLAAAVEARFAELSEMPFADQPALEDYLDGTEGAGFHLAAHVLDVPRTPATQAALRAAGKGFGLVRVLQSLPRQLTSGRLLLPSDWPQVDALRDAASRSGETAPALAALRARCAAAARQQIATLHGFSAEIPHSLNAAILPCALVEPYLQALERVEPDALRSTADLAALITPLKRVWRLWRAHRRGRI